MKFTRVWFPSAWYCDATSTDHAVLYPDKKIGTSRGDLPLPAGGNVLHLRCAELKGRFCVAGQGGNDGKAWLWNGGWHALTPLNGTYGTSTCCFGPLGLYVSTPNAVDNIKVYDVESLQLVTTLTKPVGARGIALITGLGMNPSDVHSVDSWYGQGGLAEYTDFGDGLLVGQGASGGLCARDGDAFQTLEPGSVQFVRASLDGTTISTAAWKDLEKGAVVVRLDRSELHQEVPVAASRNWFAPAIASKDLIALLDQPEALHHVDALTLPVQDVIFDGANQGPNTSTALIQADFYRRLSLLEIPFGIEMGSVKPGDCEAVANTHNLEQAVEVVTLHGGSVTYVSAEEPLTAWQDGCKARTIQQVADSVAGWMKRATELGIPQVGWIEAWPHIGFAVQQQFLDLLRDRGVVPAYWHLDIDWNTATSQHKDTAAFIKAAAALAEARGITLGLYVNSTVDPIATDAAHFANLQALTQKLHGILPDAKRLVVAAWAFRQPNGQGLQDVPNNLGPNGLLASLADTVSVFSPSDPPTPEPPPVEIHNMPAYGSPILGFNPGTLEPHPDGDGAVAVHQPDKYWLCVTPDGTVQKRPVKVDGSLETDAAKIAAYKPGAWEKFRKAKNGASLIAERDGGRVYVLALAE